MTDTLNAVACAHCREVLIALEPKDDPRKKWICDDCYMKLLEPDYTKGESYRQ